MKFIRKPIGRFLRYLKTGKTIQNDPYFLNTKILTTIELEKRPKRTEIINFLMALTKGVNYLEIGVRNPNENFNQISCKHKYSVDPAVEFKDNPVTFQLTSDAFFADLASNSLEIPSEIKFDIIFIDGLHLAEQVDRDVLNSLEFISPKGFIVLHDCNPPTEFHQREDYYFRNSPAKGFWNGTTWKAFYKFRTQKYLYSLCFDTDFGVGVISKTEWPLFNTLSEVGNVFFEYHNFELHRKEHLNLQNFEVWKTLIMKKQLKK